MVTFTIIEWAKATAEGDIREYVKSKRKRVTLNWVIGHLRFLIRWGLTKDDLLEIISRIEKDPVYRPIQTPEGMNRLNQLKAKITL